MRRADIIAGISVAGLMLPEAVAYAGIAGLPAWRAIAAAIVGCLCYVIVGRSRFAIVSPTSSSAAILAATLAVFPGDAAYKAAIATVAVALVAMIFLLAALARLGGLTGFVSRPVLRGFAFGLAVTIIIRQLPVLVGTDAEGTSIFGMVASLAMHVGQWNLPSLAIGCAALAGLLALRRAPAVPGPFLVLIVGIALSYLFDLSTYNVAMVGLIDTTLKWPSLPSLSFQAFSHLAQLVLPLALILFAESWGTIRALALRYGDAVEPGRELSALGLANAASALVQGMPVGAGFSAGSAAEAAGAKSQWTGVSAALSLTVLIVFALPLLAILPKPVLAAVVIAALTHALNLAPLVKLWRLDRDQYVALAAAIGVMVLGVLDGTLLAIGLSLVAVIQRLARPNILQLGQLGRSRDYVDMARHPEATSPPGILIYRPSEPLFFANAERILAAVSLAAEQEAKDKDLVLSLEQSFDLDSTALEVLIDFDRSMALKGHKLWFARVRNPVRDLFLAAGVADMVSRSSYSTDDAVRAALAGRDLKGSQ